MHHFTALSLATLAFVSGCGIASTLLASKAPSTTSSAQPQATKVPPFAKRTDDGMTSRAHEKYVGQIVFASQPIDRATPDEGAFVAEAYADEVIYGRAYLPHSFENEPLYANGSERVSRMANGEYVVKVTVDGKEHPALLERRNVRDNQRTSTTVQVWPRPAPDKEPTSDTWLELVNGLSVGRHEIRLELWAREGSLAARTPLAAGTLTLHKTADMRIGTGVTARDLPAGMTDAALDRELLSAAQIFAKAKRWKETIPGLTIHSPQWELVILNKRSQHVSARRLFAWVHLEHGARCSAQYIQFEQKMHGKLTRGAVYVRELGPIKTLDCAPVAVASDRWGGRTRTRPRPTKEPRVDAPTTVATATPAQRPAAAASANQRVATEPAPAGHADARAEASASALSPRRATVDSNDRSPGRLSLGLGLAANALDAGGVASYGSLGVHLGRVELGAGATWPLNALAYARVSFSLGRLELAPMITATALAEMDQDTTFALAGGISVAYVLVTGRVRMGLRLDALASYNPQPAQLALPLLGSTYVRF